jgi:hypothetical protein
MIYISGGRNGMSATLAAMARWMLIYYLMLTTILFNTLFTVVSALKP